jgi:hypothetical protein
MVLAMVRRGGLRRPRVQKLRAKGLSGCHPSGQQPRQPDGGPEGQIRNYSHDNLLKETSNGPKQLVKEKNFMFTKKGKTLTLCSNLELAGGDVVVDEDVDE